MRVQQASGGSIFLRRTANIELSKSSESCARGTPPSGGSNSQKFPPPPFWEFEEALSCGSRYGGLQWVEFSNKMTSTQMYVRKALSYWLRRFPAGRILQNWALVSELGFSDFRLSRSFVFESILENPLVRYRGKIIKVFVLERPWTKWRVLRAIPSALKLQFTVKC